LSDCWIHILLKHKEKRFKTLCNLNHINFKITCHCSNNKLLFSIVCLVGRCNYSIHNHWQPLLHYIHTYCKVHWFDWFLFELNSIKLLKHKLKFLLNLWSFVLYFKELLALLYHSSHIAHIILWLSACLNSRLKSKQLLLQLLFIQNLFVRLLQSFKLWTTLILNLWLW